ncbi:MAG TPA: hypothetical protein VKZ58_08130 [Longimicrobiales bacterium]|nr:hypothetical protein [Longimicrobiales bacterium]
MRNGIIVLFLALLCAGPASGQTARVSAAVANFRSAPNGSLLAAISRGTELRLGAADGEWREATLEGWIWSASVRPRSGGQLDLAVSAQGGENLRAEPNGPVIAKLQPGMLLQQVERRGTWTRVRRTGWVWGSALEVKSDAAQAVASGGTERAEPAGRAEPGAGQPSGARPAGAADTVAAAGEMRLGPAGGFVLDGRAGDTIAALRPRIPVEVLARDGDWVRVRLEGWVRATSLATSADTGEVLVDLEPAALLGNPGAYENRLIEWTIQYISLDRAERIRTDFREGEPFMLARGPGQGGGFVYIAVPEDMVEVVRRLAPLSRVRVLARVRVGRSALLGAPVLDLVELR